LSAIKASADPLRRTSPRGSTLRQAQGRQARHTTLAMTVISDDPRQKTSGMTVWAYEVRNYSSEGVANASGTDPYFLHRERYAPSEFSSQGKTSVPEKNNSYRVTRSPVWDCFATWLDKLATTLAMTGGDDSTYSSERDSGNIGIK